MISRQDVEKFLKHKYGTEIFKYKGFKYVRDIIAENEDYIVGNTVKIYNEIAAMYDDTYTSVERAIRYFKNMLNNEEQNTVFINNLIFEFKEWKKENA